MKPLIDKILQDLETAQRWDAEEGNTQGVQSFERAINIVKYHAGRK